jgi:uncharacterized protein (DUF1919 family)
MKKQPKLGENERREMMSKDNVQSVSERHAEESDKVMDELDKIPFPIVAQIYFVDHVLEYRNRAFWKAFEEKDKTMRRTITNFLNTKK